MKHGVLNRFSACGWFVCLSADSETQANPVILSSTSYTYDRLGRQLTAIAAGVSTNLYAYSRYGQLTAIAAGVSTNLYAYSRYGQLTNEVAQNLCASAPLRETISRATDTLGRSTGFNLDDGYAVSYGYDAYGRFDSVSSADNTYTYSYLPGANTVSGMAASSGHSWQRTFEPQRNLISAVENTYGSTVISRFDYVNDAIGRRVSRVDSGQAFQNPAFDVYSYNERSEVVGAQRYHGADVSDTSKPYGGRGFGYAYDPIGNRTSATETIGGETLTKTYTANALNQYTAIANPDAVALRGVATNTATVTVNGNAASRDSVVSTWTSWHHALPTDNANGGVFTFAEIMAAINPPGTNTPDLVSTASGHIYAPPQAETLAYDDDGNLLNDGRFTYTWNGENRLIKAEELISPTNRQPHVVEYTYDHRGRMIWKTVASSNAPSSKAIRYLWDDYNIVAETVVQDTATNTTYNIWGLDVDGTLQGAGGVGGLLAVVKDSATYIPAYDANGNIMEYVASDGRIVAHREYDPFGGTVVYTSQSAITNQQSAISFAHWFSTKPWCSVTGLSEYQYRKYSPATGRWLSRDPIGEEGDLNRYGFVRQDPIASIDLFGLEKCGPDVTSSFYRNLVEAQERFNAATPQERVAGCYKYLDTTEAIGGQAWDFFFPPVADGGPGCEETVTLNGGCHYRWEINYALFGVLNRLCGRTLEEAQGKAAAYKIGLKTLANIVDGNFTLSIGTPDSTFEWNPRIHEWVFMGYKGHAGYKGKATPFEPVRLECCDPSDQTDYLKLFAWPWEATGMPLPIFTYIGETPIILGPLFPKPEMPPTPK